MSSSSKVIPAVAVAIAALLAAGVAGATGLVEFGASCRDVELQHESAEIVHCPSASPSLSEDEVDRYDDRLFEVLYHWRGCGDARPLKDECLWESSLSLDASYFKITMKVADAAKARALADALPSDAYALIIDPELEPHELLSETER